MHLPFTARSAALSTRRATTGSAYRVTPATSAKLRRSADRSWQQKALDYSEMIPEADYATTFYGGGMSKLRLGVQVYDSELGWQWTTDAADKAVQLWSIVQDPGGGQSRMAKMYGELMFTCGEGYLCCTWDDAAQMQVFEFLSVEELRPTGEAGRYERHPSTGAGETLILTEAEDGALPTMPGEVIVWRMWEPSRRRSEDAHSPMKAVADVCQELLDMTHAVSATTRSRLARAGILFLPDGLSEPADENPSYDTDPGDVDPDDDPQADPLIAEMIEHWLHPLSDMSSPNIVAPYIVRGLDKESRDSILHLKLYETSDAYPEIALRDETVKRFARGIQLPLEIIMGMAEANHWSGWLVDDQTWLAHLQPKALGMVTDLTNVYLWAGLQRMGLSTDVVRSYRVWYDETNLVVNPDRSRDAKDAHAHKAISDKAFRRELDFEEGDAPTPEDPNSYPGAARQGDNSSPAGPADTSQTPPGEGVQASARLEAEAWLLGAKMAAIERLREHAGARLRSRVRTALPDVYAAHARTANADLAAHLGEGVLSRVGGDLTALGLVRGGTVPLDRLLRGAGWGLDQRARLCAEVESIAATTLFLAAVTAEEAAGGEQAA